jgi:hypothetical protein
MPDRCEPRRARSSIARSATRGAAASGDGKVRSHEIARYVSERMKRFDITVDLHMAGDPFVVILDTELRHAAGGPPLEDAAEGDPGRLVRAESARQQIERVVDPNREVVTSIENPDASIVQSWVEERGAPTPSRRWWQFSDKFGPQDWFGWAGSIFSWTDRQSRNPMLRPSGVTFEPLPNTARVGVVGNFGTGLYGASVIAETIRRDPHYDLLLHLGGVFYSGTEKEVHGRFLAFWPREAAAINRALNGNYEIDTAYTDQTIDDEQYAWLEAVLAAARRA